MKAALVLSGVSPVPSVRSALFSKCANTGYVAVVSFVFGSDDPAAFEVSGTDFGGSPRSDRNRLMMAVFFEVSAVSSRLSLCASWTLAR